MSRKLFQILDRVHGTWPFGASAYCFQIAAPPLWALDAAHAVVSSWTTAEYLEYRRQLPALAAMLSALYQRMVVAAMLALLLGLTVAVSAGGAGALTDLQPAMLVALVCAIVLPPIAICNGVARDYVAARALLAACSALAVEPARREAGGR